MPVIDYGSKNGSPTNFQGTNFDYDYPRGLDLKPGSSLHTKLVSEIKKRALASQRVMSSRYDDWNTIDRTLTAFINLDDKEKKSKAEDDRKPTSIVFPYSYAIMETLLGYLTAAFFQDPIFRYEGVSPEDTLGAIMMEKVIDLHCNKSKVALNLHTMFRDDLAYGFGVSAPGWTKRVGWKTIKAETGIMGILGKLVGGGSAKKSEESILFEGNELSNIDPYLCLPDPNVSIHDQQKGEFFGWIEKTNLMDMLSTEKNNKDIFNVKYLKSVQNKRSALFEGDKSERERRTGGVSRINDDNITSRVDNVNMFIKIIPSEWNLSNNDYPEKWAFCLSADEVITKCKPLDLDHNMFPIAISAGDFDGYSSTPVSRIEMLSGMQGILDWLFNTHISNVKKAINDMLIVDPYLVNVKDIEDPKPGKLIRLRRPAWGKGVKDAVQQLAVQDVTKGHIADSSWIVQWMQKIGAADDAAMGALRQGGPERLTGKEFEGTRAGAFSRLERMARIIALQAMQDIGYMFASHTKQLMSEDLYVTTSGQWQQMLMTEYGDRINKGKMKVSPFDILVDYDIKVRDGSVPGSNYSEVWTKMFQMIATEPHLMQKFDIVKVFEHIARNNGAKNIEEFEIMPMPDEQVQQQVQAGNMVPLQDIAQQQHYLPNGAQDIINGIPGVKYLQQGAQ